MKNKPILSAITLGFLLVSLNASSLPLPLSNEEIVLESVKHPWNRDDYFDYDGNGTMDFRYNSFIISLDENYSPYILGSGGEVKPYYLKGYLFNFDEYPDYFPIYTSYSGANLMVSNGFQLEPSGLMCSIDPYFQSVNDAFMDYNNDGRLEFYFQGDVYSYNHDGNIIREPWRLTSPSDFTNERGTPPSGLVAQDINQALFYDMFGIGWGANNSLPYYHNPFDFSSIDLNGDGFMDMVDKGTGLTYINDGRGSWIEHYLGGQLVVRDFNNDNVMDYVVYNDKKQTITLYVAQPEIGQFKEIALANGLLFGNSIWTYDFDKDGDIDLLIPVSWENSGKFLLLIENRGNLNFKKHEFFIEESHGFVNCIDIDADGCLELISFIEESTGERWQYSLDSYKVSNSNTIDTKPTRIANSIPRDGGTNIFIGDFRNDGSMRIVSKEYNGEYIELSPNKNQRPKSPTKPIYNYDAASGLVKINWGPGSDAESSSVDLTYELRVGTEPGKCDIMPVMSLADGTRRAFREGNNGYSTQRILNTASWPDGKIYISVQSIDPNLKGSEFSEYAILEKGPGTDFFITSDEFFCINETCTLTLRNPVNNSFSYKWDLDGGRIVEQNSDGSIIKISYEKEGNKEISLTVTDSKGNTSTTKKTLSVLPGLKLNEPLKTSEYIWGEYIALDFDCDGITELLYNYYNLNTHGPGYSYMLQYNESGSYERIKKLWNTNIATAFPKSADINHDGLPDIIYSSNFLINEGELDVTTQTLEKPNTFANRYVDFNNDGNLDCFYIGSQRLIHIYPNTGNYISYEDAIVLGERGDSSSWTQNIILQDFDGNGFIDIGFVQLSGFFSKGAYGIFYNNGDFNFTLSLFSPRSQGAYIVDLFDLDNDNKIDILVQTRIDDKYYYKIEWGNGNETILEDLYEINDVMAVIDADNNGYKDIVVKGRGKSDTKIFTYIINILNSNNAEIAKIGPETFPPDLNNYPQDIYNKWHLFYEGNNRLRVNLKYTYSEDPALGVLNLPNQKPLPPTGLRSAQSSKGVMLEWNHSLDKETPANAMNYNLSVKRKGKDGEGSYLISPMNCGKNGVHVPSDMVLIPGNRYFIPIDKIEPGEYEVKVQGIDLWKMESDFSDTYNLIVTESIDIELPASTFVGKETAVSIKSNITTQIDWDGAIVTTNNDNDCYLVKWDEAGTKTVTVGGHEYEILVKPLPEFKCELPEQVQAKAKVIVKGINLDNVQIKATPNYTTFGDDQGQRTIMFNKPGEYIVTAETEIDHILLREEYKVKVTEPETPEIALVGIDADKGQYCVNVKNGQQPNDVTALNIYKETSSQGVYRLIATVDPSTPCYIDEDSYPTIKAEKYKLSWQLSYGESKSSQEHKPLHIMLNKGAGTSWNLIWNKYEGLEVDTYQILRGSTPENLSIIAEISGSMSSYSDVDAPTGELYYAVEIRQTSTQLRAHGNTASGSLSSRSNVISTNDANDVVLVETINLKSINGDNKIDASVKDNLQLVAFLYPATATYHQLNWIVVDGSDIVEVDQKGLVTAKTNGNATIRAYTLDGSELYADFDVEVSGVPILVTSLTFAEKEVNVKEGSTYIIEAIILPENATIKDLTWISSDEFIVTVSSDGEITAVSPGQAVVSAVTEDGSELSAECLITVSPKTVYPEEILLEYEGLDMKVGEEASLIYTIYPENATEIDLIWSSENNGIATVVDGVIKAISAGETIITVTTVNGKTAQCTVTVNKVLQEIIWDQTFENVFEGDILTLTAKATSGLDVEYEIILGTDKAMVEKNILTVNAAGEIQINALQKGDEIYEAAEPITKMINAESGIQGIIADDIKMHFEGSDLIIEGNIEIEIYQVDGTIVYKGHGSRIPLQKNTVYIIRHAGGISKILPYN